MGAIDTFFIMKHEFGDFERIDLQKKKHLTFLVWRKKEKSVLELMIARTARFCKKSIDQYQFLGRRRYVTATFTFPLKRLM